MALSLRTTSDADRGNPIESHPLRIMRRMLVEDHAIAGMCDVLDELIGIKSWDTSLLSVSLL